MPIIDIDIEHSSFEFVSDKEIGSLIAKQVGAEMDMQLHTALPSSTKNPGVGHWEYEGFAEHLSGPHGLGGVVMYEGRNLRDILFVGEVDSLINKSLSDNEIIRRLKAYKVYSIKNEGALLKYIKLRRKLSRS